MDHGRLGWRRWTVGLGLASVLVVMAGPARADGPTAAKKPERVKLAFLGLRPLAGVDKGKAQAVSAYLLDALQARGVYQVLAPDDVKALLGLEAQKQLLGCNEDSSCLAQIAGSLGASRLLNGTLARIGNSILVSVNLLDTTKAEAVVRVSRRVKTASTLEPVLDVIPELVDEVIAGDPSVSGAGASTEGGPAATGAQTGATATGAAAGSVPRPPPDLRRSRPRLTLGLEARGGTSFWNAGGSTGFGPGGSFDVFGLLRVTWFDIGASVGVEGNLFGGAASTLAHGVTRIDLRIHLWTLPYVQLYVGPGIRSNPFGFRAVLGADWPLHVFGREDFAILTDLDVELYPRGVSTHLTVGLGYSFL